MLACLDVDYRPDHAIAAAVVFRDWPDATPAAEHTATIRDVAPYVPGQFYRRELPCLLAVLRQIPHPLRGIVIDGYVHLDAAHRPGLGAHLHDALGGPAASPFIIGVAKTPFATAPAEQALRGQSAAPLYVTAVGIDPRVAADHVRAMHGPHRVPTLLKRVDRLCRHA